MDDWSDWSLDREIWIDDAMSSCHCSTRSSSSSAGPWSSEYPDMYSEVGETEDRSVNTNEDWESETHAVVKCNSEVNAQYEALVKQQAAEQEEHNLHVSSLRKTRDDRKHKYKEFLDKIDSLQDKLKLNSSKTTRKNFMAKRQELTAEKGNMEQEKAKLVQELEETENKLKSLIEEQSHEKLSWEQEIGELRLEMEMLCKQADQASQTALKDELTALKMQEELALSQVDDWIDDAEKYLNFLRTKPSQQHLRQKWEQNLVMVRGSVAGLKKKFNENYQLLQRGEPLESLPSVQLPFLPLVPMLEVIMSPLHNAPPPPVFNNSLAANTSSAPIAHQLQSSVTAPQSATLLLAAPSIQNTSGLPKSAPHTGNVSNVYASMTTHAPASSTPNQPSTFPSISSSSHAPLAPSSQTLQKTHGGVPPASYAPLDNSSSSIGGLPNTQGASFPAHGAVHLPQNLVPTNSTRNSSPQPLPSNPAPAGKLDKLLERLGSQFPQCTREQLTRVLQQIKSERGTMAGMSMDDVIQQVAQRLALNQRQPPGPIGPPSGVRASVGPIQRPVTQAPHPMRPQFHPPVTQVFQTRPPQPSSRKFCLMCQNTMDTGTQYNTNCSHIMHRECVSVWLQTSKNNSCPFCPSK